MARASRILVEGVHDAELVEKVWGDDLRHEGIVVERLDGADHLDGELRSFRPGPGRRLGVLLDHLVDGSKESRIAAGAASEHVLVTRPPLRRHLAGGQARRASASTPGPTIPTRHAVEGRRVRRARAGATPATLWRRILASLSSWTDLETPLVNAVERLIDFVSEA